VPDSETRLCAIPLSLIQRLNRDSPTLSRYLKISGHQDPIHHKPVPTVIFRDHFHPRRSRNPLIKDSARMAEPAGSIDMRNPLGHVNAIAASRQHLPRSVVRIRSDGKIGSAAGGFRAVID
jgi:hypothetical protein